MRSKKWAIRRIIMILAGIVLAVGFISCSTVADEPASNPDLTEEPEEPEEPDGQPDPDTEHETDPLVGQWRLHIDRQFDYDKYGHHIWVNWVDLSFTEDGSLTYSYERHKIDNGNIVEQEVVESGRHSFTKTDDRIVIYDELLRQRAEFKYVITDDRLTLTLTGRKGFPAFFVKGYIYSDSYAHTYDFEAGVIETYLKMPIQIKENWNSDIVGKWKAWLGRVINVGSSTTTDINDMYLEFKDGVNMTFSYVITYQRKVLNWDGTLDHVDTSYSEVFGDEYTYKMSDDIIFIYPPGEDTPVVLLGYTMIDDQMEVTLLEGLPIPYILYSGYQIYPFGSRKYTKIIE